MVIKLLENVNSAKNNYNYEQLLIWFIGNIRSCVLLFNIAYRSIILKRTITLVTYPFYSKVQKGYLPKFMNMK